MADKKKIKRKGTTRVVGKVVCKGRDVWRIASDGRVRSITTRRRSAQAIDEAVMIYGPALQRLANR